MEIRQLTVYFCVLVFVKCGYPPIGDEVQVGSVLLPATRRGRYLANIVRRQAVDGTGIKFNKDADRMNAEAKKKVDVLSEELLPYIIAEQERRTTLYKRVMTAIQNGEKGVTIAEIRNKPPLIIRKGLMYRCPSNRVPKEPDGSGIIMCENDIEPTPVMYDSCLSAEDKDLYVADNKYFFCNRHKVEGPDLPRNGTTVIGCAPAERTSLNYTTMKCALEDTDDVVVHYRYYPDRTYKFVTELDPDREVCDHWNPCQIGYIFSLPAPDQALPANELWRDYVVDNYPDYERDEIIPPIAEDTSYEFVHAGCNYETSPRRINVPQGYKFDSVWKGRDPYSKKMDMKHKVNPENIRVKENPRQSARRRGSRASGKYITLSIYYPKFHEGHYGQLYAVFRPKDGKGKKETSEFYVTLAKATVELDIKKIHMMPQGTMDPVLIEYKCKRCRVQGVVVRGDDGMMYNLDSKRYKTIQMSDGRKAVQIQLNNPKAKDFGTYMFTFLNDEGTEEVIQALQLHAPERDTRNLLKASVMRSSSAIGDHFDKTVTYTCDGCDLTDVTCNGESVTSGGRVSIVPGVKMISFNFPSFEDSNACVYMGLFKQDGAPYMKIIAVVDNDSPAVSVVEYTGSAPSYGELLDFEVPISCQDECEVEKVTVNGAELENAPTRRSGDGPMAYFVTTSSSIAIRIAEFSEMFEGTYMAVFKVGQDTVTKTIAEIKDSSTENQEETQTSTPESTTSPDEPSETGTPEPDSQTVATDATTTEANAPDATTSDATITDENAPETTTPPTDPATEALTETPPTEPAET